MWRHHSGAERAGIHLGRADGLRVTSGTSITTSLRRLVQSIGTRLDGTPLVVLLDIDGTLAPIAPRPEDAVVPGPTREIVARLATLPGVVVTFVTGRSAEDALRMIDVPGA